MPELRPRNGYLVVRVIEEDEKRGSLIVPPGVAPWPLRGIVLAADDNYRLSDGSEQDLHPGDEVLFFKDKITELRIGDERVVLIHEEFVLAVTDPAVVYERGAS